MLQTTVNKELNDKAFALFEKFLDVTDAYEEENGHQLRTDVVIGATNLLYAQTIIANAPSRDAAHLILDKCLSIVHHTLDITPDHFYYSARK